MIEKNSEAIALLERGLARFKGQENCVTNWEHFYESADGEEIKLWGAQKDYAEHAIIPSRFCVLGGVCIEERALCNDVLPKAVTAISSVVESHDLVFGRESYTVDQVRKFYRSAIQYLKGEY